MPLVVSAVWFENAMFASHLDPEIMQMANLVDRDGKNPAEVTNKGMKYTALQRRVFLRYCS